MEWREKDGVRWLEADLDGVRAAFSTRLGGVSEPPFDSLNLGILTDDDRAAVEENRRRLATALGREPEQVVFALQVHGTRLIEHDTPVSAASGEFRGFVLRGPGAKGPPERGGGPGGGGVGGVPLPRPDPTPHPRNGGIAEADGHVVREAGLAPLVFVADCLPVALYGPGGLAMVHAGWRGLAGGIVGAAADAVEATAAAIGPGIGPCCYEVGEEVLDAFSGLGEGVAEGRMLDLPETARRFLAAAGVERVQSAGLCTSCEEELFFSHRRDRGRTGRQAGIAWIETE
ncbi:MAG: polyphenol oxidase family protein [Solirubrobacterales bacterium]